MRVRHPREGKNNFNATRAKKLSSEFENILEKNL